MEPLPTVAIRTLPDRWSRSSPLSPPRCPHKSQRRHRHRQARSFISAPPPLAETIASPRTPSRTVPITRRHRLTLTDPTTHHASCCRRCCLPIRGGCARRRGRGVAGCAPPVFLRLRALGPLRPGRPGRGPRDGLAQPQRRRSAASPSQPRSGPRTLSLLLDWSFVFVLIGSGQRGTVLLAGNSYPLEQTFLGSNAAKDWIFILLLLLAPGGVSSCFWATDRFWF